MKFLLTSAGISNASIHNALVDLLGKPIASPVPFSFLPQSIPCPLGLTSPKVICGSLGDPFCEMGWKSLGVLELTALPSIKKELWVPCFRRLTPCWLVAAIASTCVTGCSSPDWQTCCRHCCARTVYVGLSAGSMVMTRFGTTYGGHTLPRKR